MPEPTEHHRDEQVVGGPIPALFCSVYIDACNQSEIAFPQIPSGQEVALPHLLNPECQEVVPEQAGVLAEQAFQYVITRERHRDDRCRPFVTPLTHAYNSTRPHGGGMLCTQAGGRHALS